jgi:hypothetical protein
MRDFSGAGDKGRYGEQRSMRLSRSVGIWKLQFVGRAIGRKGCVPVYRALCASVHRARVCMEPIASSSFYTETQKSFNNEAVEGDCLGISTIGANRRQNWYVL